MQPTSTSPETTVYFDLEKVRQTHKAYHENHPGLTLVVGHPFEDKAFLDSILKEQASIKEIFQKFDLDSYLILYEPEQIHGTIIELASQHDESQVHQKTLSDQELTLSKKGNHININFAMEWINQTEPFDVELGVDVLSKKHKDQTILIAPTGQILMKGRAKQRDLFAKIRGEFEDQSAIVHKYSREDDEFFFVIGYLIPFPHLNNANFIKELTSYIHSRREVIQLSMRVTSVSVILYQQRTLSTSKCLKQWDFKLKHKPSTTDLSQKVKRYTQNKLSSSN